MHFDVPAPVCKARVAARVDHPTIPHGEQNPTRFFKRSHLSYFLFPCARVTAPLSSWARNGGILS